MLSRSDWKDSCQLPIGIIGGGSGNAISKNIDAEHTEIAVLTLIHNQTRPLDVFSYSQGKQVHYSHLSLSWTFIADLDIESDRYRWLGSERFTLAAIIRLIRLRTYHGRLYILPASESADLNAPGMEDIHAPHPLPEEYQSWPIVVDSEFKFFLATNYPYISSDFLASPRVSLNSGCMDVIWSCDMNRKQALETVLNPSTGAYLHASFIHSQKAIAFVLEPGEFWLTDCSRTRFKSGILNVSGEVVPYEPLSVQVLPRLMKIFSFL